MTPYGRVIFLNGGSSSGKTSLARALQESLDEPYLHLDADILRLFLPWRFLVRAATPHPKGSTRFVRGFHRAAAAFADTGNNVIIDHMLTAREWLDDAVVVLAHLAPLFVGVRCRVDVAMERERVRGDRPKGIAATSAARAHADAIYDLEVDASVEALDKLADRIARRLASGEAPHAFARMLARQQGQASTEDVCPPEPRLPGGYDDSLPDEIA